ncbi:MAG: phosphoesterase [Acidobacteriota bacterium]|nr:phosphoesterase [Acidobacteriota bacterium]
MPRRFPTALAAVAVAGAALTVGACAAPSGTSRSGSAAATAPGSPHSTTSAGGATAPTAPGATATPAGAATVDAGHPCSGAPPAPVRHVVVVMMENRALAQVAGNPAAPYLASLAAACGLATDYSGVAHPSLPNYIAVTSGSTQGVADDAGPGSHPLGAPSIFSLLGADWRSLEESMPRPCDTASSGEYAVKHNPAAYYTTLATNCPAQDLPLNGGAFDLSAAYTFVTPDLCHDGHDCSTATADAWLAKEVPVMLSSPQYRSGSTVVFITWDENDAGGALVPTYVISPSVIPGARVATPLDHYSLLRTSEELLGLSPLLGQAATATSMVSLFHL